MKKKGRGRPRKNVTFLTVKKKTDFDLSLKLQQERVINILGVPFEQANKKEINGLVAHRIFAFE
jgi:hypothetical protein